MDEHVRQNHSSKYQFVPTPKDIPSQDSESGFPTENEHEKISPRKIMQTRKSFNNYLQVNENI